MSNERASFESIYEELRPKIDRYLSRLVGRTDAEDLAQDVFAKVNQALPEFRGDSKLSTWVYRIATNVAHDHWRRTRAERAAAVGVLDRLADETDSAEDEVARTSMNQCVRRHIEDLPPSYRSVLLLSEDEGLRDREIAAALGISVAAVKIRLHRARTRLKTAFHELCYRDEANGLACKPPVSAVERASTAT